MNLPAPSYPPQTADLHAAYAALVERYGLEIIEDDDDWTFDFVQSTARPIVRVDRSESGQTWITTFDTIDELTQAFDLEEGWDCIEVVDLSTGQQFFMQATWTAVPQ